MLHHAKPFNQNHFVRWCLLIEIPTFLLIFFTEQFLSLPKNKQQFHFFFVLQRRQTYLTLYSRHAPMFCTLFYETWTFVFLMLHIYCSNFHLLFNHNTSILIIVVTWEIVANEMIKKSHYRLWTLNGCKTERDTCTNEFQLKLVNFHMLSSLSHSSPMHKLQRRILSTKKNYLFQSSTLKKSF